MANETRMQRRLKRKENKESMIQAQREHFKKRERNKKIFNYTILAVVVLALAYGLYVALKPEPLGQYDDFAKCITKSGSVMYGTDWCSHCQAQKRLFGASFKYISYVNCDMNKPACDAAGVEGYPTWQFPSGPQLSGEQSLETLAERSGCTLE